MGDSQVEYFKRLFRYDRWANGEALAALEAAQEPPAKALRWLAHLAGAGCNWLARMSGTECSLAIWPELTLEQCESSLKESGEGWLAYLDGLETEQLSKSVNYRDSRGAAHSAVLSDILTHVVTHGGYHRGQIAAEMRAQGLEPAKTDFIIAVLTGALKS